MYLTNIRLLTSNFSFYQGNVLILTVKDTLNDDRLITRKVIKGDIGIKKVIEIEDSRKQSTIKIKKQEDEAEQAKWLDKNKEMPTDLKVSLNR